MRIPLPPDLQPSNEMLMLIAAIEEFKGEWRALAGLDPEVLRSLRRIATIESAGSSTRIEGAKLSDSEVETLLGSLGKESFQSRGLPRKRMIPFSIPCYGSPFSTSSSSPSIRFRMATGGSRVS